MSLASPVTFLPGIGASITSKLVKLGISTVFDLLYHLPSRYEDCSQVSDVVKTQAGETITVIGTITSIKNEFTKSRKFIQKAVITDSTGNLDVVWFNQAYLVKALTGKKVGLYGKVDFFGRSKTLISPDYEIKNTNYSSPSLESRKGDRGGGLLHMGRIVPIYPETAGISSKWLRSKIYSLLQTLPDSDPWPAPNKASGEVGPAAPQLSPWKKSLQNMHFPQKTGNWQLAIDNSKRRLAFDELFLLQLRSQIHKEHWLKTLLSHPFHIDSAKAQDFISSLPFSLTPSQSQAITEILSDLAQSVPMNRLLEGDVGSGKTVVAAAAAYQSHLNGFQTILLAPTQILAHQHFQTLSELFLPFDIHVSLITSQGKISTSHLELSTIFVGTHALLSDKNQDLVKNVGLVVIDEQHRFGVIQRALAARIGRSPHILTMTATPIPRSVALTMFGDLDLSLLRDMPPGRQLVKTWVVPESKRDAACKWINDQMENLSCQVFWVCPFIHDSETLSSVKAVTTEFEHLKQMFPKFKLGLLHGKLKSEQKTQVINAFRAGEYQLLVTTPIVEVGIDIQAASIMVIEGADRFGLAGLHQLRGRVGRGSDQAYCLLFTTNDQVIPRLKLLETTHSGIELAEADLKLRGPGDIYGTAQHGILQFKVATFSDLDLSELAKAHAQKILPQIENYPVLRDLLKNDKIAIIQPN